MSEIINPVEFKVLIEVEEVEDRSAGGIFLPDQTIERDQYAHNRGKLVKAGCRAFEDWPEPPKIGDFVLFNKYAGTGLKERKPDNREVIKYRLCNDQDIVATITGGNNNE